MHVLLQQFIFHFSFFYSYEPRPIWSVPLFNFLDIFRSHSFMVISSLNNIPACNPLSSTATLLDPFMANWWHSLVFWSHKLENLIAQKFLGLYHNEVFQKKTLKIDVVCSPGQYCLSPKQAKKQNKKTDGMLSYHSCHCLLPPLFLHTNLTQMGQSLPVQTWRSRFSVLPLCCGCGLLVDVRRVNYVSVSLSFPSSAWV